MLRNIKRKHPLLRDVLLCAEVGVIYLKLAFYWLRNQLPFALMGTASYRMFKGW